MKRISKPDGSEDLEPLQSILARCDSGLICRENPFSQLGGLSALKDRRTGDAVGALGKALAGAGHEKSRLSPTASRRPGTILGLRRVDWKFDLPLGAKRVDAAFLALEAGLRLTVYFIDKPEYFDRAGIYNDHGGDYGDNAERFIFFSKCVVHLARHLPLKPEILHVRTIGQPV